MLKNTLEEIRNKVLEDRREKEKQRHEEHLENIRQKYSEIISKIVSGLTKAAQDGYTSCAILNVENFYMTDEDELNIWARSEDISLSYKKEKGYVTKFDDRSKIKVIEIFPKF